MFRPLVEISCNSICHKFSRTWHFIGVKIQTVIFLLVLKFKKMKVPYFWSNRMFYKQNLNICTQNLFSSRNLTYWWWNGNKFLNVRMVKTSRITVGNWEIYLLLCWQVSLRILRSQQIWCSTWRFGYMIRNEKMLVYT